MRSLPFLLAGMVGLASLIHAPVVAALGIQETEAITLFGGTYSTDCANPAAPHLRIAEKLSVEQGKQRMSGDNLMAAASYLGPEPPPGFQTALLGEVRRDARLIFIVSRDRQGLYIELMGEDPKVEAALIGVLGRAQYKAKYRDCDIAKRTARPQGVPPATDPADDISSWDYSRDTTFKTQYRRALGAKAATPWISSLNGPSSGAKPVQVAGKEYRQLAVCKPHDCGDNSLVVLYLPAKKVVYGKIVEREKSTVFGNPPPAVAAELDRLWKAEWRQAQ